MKTFVKLNKNEMKMVMGGETEPESVIGGEEDTAGKYPKIEACVGKAHGDSCIFTYKNYNYSTTVHKYHIALIQHKWCNKHLCF